MTHPDRLVVASRGSKLALRQAELVADLVRGMHPAIEIEVVTVRTRGDADKKLPFAALGAKGIFTTEVERAVLDGRADLAVHSAKDLTAELAAPCVIACVPSRASVADVVVGGAGRWGEERLAALNAGARVGTSSMRRRVLLAEVRPDLEVVEFRGNLDTRLGKVEEGLVDAAILAAAGLERLGLEAGPAGPPQGRAGSAEAERGGGPGGPGALDEPEPESAGERDGSEVMAAPLDPGRWVPAPGQGALVIETLRARNDLIDFLAPLSDAAASAEVACERYFSKTLEGGCSVPLGCHARADGGRLLVTGFLGSPYGDQTLRDRISGSMGEAEELGRELANAMLAAGGRDIVDDIKASQGVEP